MAIVLLLAFVITPIIEIAVFIEIGGLIGLWPTIAVVVVTALAGAALLRAQGLATLARAQQSLARGEFPVRQVFDGACLLVAGALLLTPGFVTDGVGLALFLPPVRDFLGRRLLASGRVRVDTGTEAAPPGGDDGIIEGEYQEVETERDAKPPPRTPLR